MRWRRHRGRVPTLSPQALADTWQLVSVLLDYPDEALPQRIPMLLEVAGSLPDGPRELLVATLTAFGQTPLADLQREYVDTFDVTRSCALHLTYATHGDTRRRGVALIEFVQAFRRAGVPFEIGAELPDHLCVVLEFGAFHDSGIAWDLLVRHRVAIELLRAGLARRESPWLGIVEALRTTLPPLVGDDNEVLARLIAAGPPQEDVGLEPYALDPSLDIARGLGPDPMPSATPDPAGRQFLGATIPLGAPR